MSAQNGGRHPAKVIVNLEVREVTKRLADGAPGRIALPVSGDDDAGKAIVLKLIDELGFDAVDAGGLDNPGGNSQARQFIPKTSISMVWSVLWLRPPKIGPKNGAAPTLVPVALPRPREAYRQTLSRSSAAANSSLTQFPGGTSAHSLRFLGDQEEVQWPLHALTGRDTSSCRLFLVSCRSLPRVKVKDEYELALRKLMKKKGRPRGIPLNAPRSKPRHQT